MFFERVFLFASVIGLETKINLVDNFLYFHSFIIFSIHKKTATKKTQITREKSYIYIIIKYWSHFMSVCFLSFSTVKKKNLIDD